METETPASTAVVDQVDGSGTIEVDGSERSLRSTIVSGLAWNGALGVSIQATRMLASLVLVRLLAPSQYGVAGMALLFTGLVLNFHDLGLGSALVQREKITEADRSTAFWATAGFGLILMGVGIGVAGPLASFFHEPQVQGLFIVLSTTFFIGSLGSTQAALIHRAMNYRAITLRLIIATVGGCVAAVVIAALGGGPWALIGQQVVVTVLSTGFLWFLSDWRPRFLFSRASLRDLGGFGAAVTGAGFLDFLQGNVDNMLVGRYLGSTSLGVYSVAYNAILVPLGRLLLPVQEALFPAISRLQSEPERIARLWLRVVRGVAAVILPTMLGLVVVAPDFVDVVLGERWHEATPVIRILAFATLAYSFTAVAARTLVALDRARLVFWFGLANAALTISAFVVGLQWGIVGVAACFTAVTVPVQAAIVVLLGRVIHVPVRRFAGAVASVVGASLLMFVVCWGIREGLIQLGVGEGLRLVIVIIVGIAVYVPATFWLSPDIVVELRALRSRRRTSAPGRAPA